MNINSAVFGSLEVDESMIFHMPEGPLGFPENSNYALITKCEDDVTLMWFQAVETSIPCFVVFNPFEIIDKYQPVLEPIDLRALGLDPKRDRDKISDLEFLVIAVVPEDITKATVNLKSPIVLNKKDRIARQVILSNADYPIQFPLVAAESEILKESV